MYHLCIVVINIAAIISWSMSYTLKSWPCMPTAENRQCLCMCYMDGKHYARWHVVASLLSEDDCMRILNGINSGRDLGACALSTRPFQHCTRTRD